MKAEMKAEGHEKILKILEGLKDGKRDEAEKSALKAAGKVVKEAVKVLPRPRSTARRKGHRGHMLDTVEAKEPVVMNGGYGTQIGFFKKKNQYAKFPEYGTVSQAAQPFLLPTHRKTQEAQVDAMQRELREGLGLI